MFILTVAPFEKDKNISIMVNAEEKSEQKAQCLLNTADFFKLVHQKSTSV
jgi:hypothetical protein